MGKQGELGFDLPRDRSGNRASRVLRISSDDVRDELWAEFGTVAIGAQPMLRQFKILQAEAANTRQTMISSVYDIVHSKLKNLLGLERDSRSCTATSGEKN